MTLRKMIAIIVIWMVAAGGWMLLGGTVMVRTEGLLDTDRWVRQDDRRGMATCARRIACNIDGHRGEDENRCFS